MASAKKAEIGDKSEKQHEDLFFFWLRKYRTALSVKKAADAAIKNCGKGIKADLGEFGLDEIKDYEVAQTEEGQQRLKARHEATLRALRFAGMPVGTQLDLLADRAPLDDRAYRDGKEAGMRGESLANPYNEASEAGMAYSKGWHDGQEAIFAIEKLKETEASGETLIKADAAPKKRGRPAKAKAGEPLTGDTPDDAKEPANQNGAAPSTPPKPPKPEGKSDDDSLTNFERETLRQARQQFN
jgi:hypothetical protein